MQPSHQNISTAGQNTSTAGQTNEQYHADTSRISKSGLDLIHRSPAHYYAERLDPNRPDREPKKHFLVGSIAHTAILEADKLEREYFILDDTRIVSEIGGGNPRATNRYKEWRALEMENAEGRAIVPVSDYDLARCMRDAVHSHPTASILLKDGVAEQTVHFTEPLTGVACKVRPDWLDNSNSLIVDLKTTDDASAEGFAKSCAKWRYHVQDSFYTDGLLSSDGDFFPSGFVFIAVEKVRPFNVGVYVLDGDSRALGQEEYMADLRVYLDCLQKGFWPGYQSQIRKIRLPRWAFSKLD